MEYRRLGRSGLHVSVAGLGCNNFGMRIDYEAAEKVTNAALDAGVTLFDTADVYGRGDSEEMLGRALGARRHEVIIATKFAAPMGEGPMDRGGSRHRITEACEASLRRLGTDYIDLYQMHMPDPETPIEETLHALDDLVRAGKVRYLGNSNYKGWQIAEAHWTAENHHLTKFVSAQNHYNLMERGVETEVVPACEPLRARHPALLPARERLPDGQVPSGAGGSRGHASGGLGSRGRGADGGELRQAGEARSLVRRARAHGARTGGRLAGVAVARGQRDLGRDQAGAARRERGGGRVADAGRGRGGGRDRYYRRTASLSRYRSTSAASALPRIPEQ